MGRREYEAFADVIESVILDIIGEAQRELEVGKVEEVSNRGLVLGFVKATRQGAADGYILQEVLIKKSQNRPPIFTAWLLLIRWRHESLLNCVHRPQPDVQFLLVAPVDGSLVEVDVAFLGVLVVTLEAVLHQYVLYWIRDKGWVRSDNGSGQYSNQKYR